MIRAPDRDEDGILIVEDDVDFAEGLADLIRAEGHQTRIAHCRQEALDLLRDFEPAVAIIDVRLGSEDGVEVLDELRRVRPRMLGLLMTAQASLDSAIAAVRSSARDYLRKPFEPKALMTAIERCLITRASLEAEGGPRPKTMDAASAKDGSNRSGSGGAPSGADLSGLTRRQREVVAHALRGGQVEDIAQAMGLSHHTVRSHLKAIYRKLGVRSRAQLSARLGTPGRSDS